ncbi:MAG: bifunctional riboflavin kinase/FAD synthetase [Synechocystis sp.]|nr:bifunctional riboflavin kinase/FAD synthetase [Synechocystis sp.]
MSTTNDPELSSAVTADQSVAIALGNFDGVHRGHQWVLEQVVAFARQAQPPLQPAVVSFSPHPRTFFSGQPQPLLTPLPEKIEQLDALGIEQLILLPFTQALATLSPQQFVETILVKQLRAKFISVGEDFRFGYQRQGTVTDLTALGQQWGLTVAIADLIQTDQARISSSQIRQALLTGKLERANDLLGRPYALVGTVVTGQQLGRTLGFPTANLALPEDKLWPQFGVYAGWVTLGAIAEPIAAVINLGDRPTVNGKEPSAEVHLLNWSGNLYGQSLHVQLHHFLRPEQKFANLEQLKSQIEADCHRAQTLLAQRDLELHCSGA